MTTEHAKRLYGRAIEAYGRDAQERMLVEEIGEYLQAANKLHRAKTLEERKVALMHLQEELADMQIMQEQNIVMAGESAVAEIKQRKIDRLAQRLGMET